MRFTVCIPSVRPDTVAAAVRSVLRQTHGDWELIVVAQGDVPAIRAVVEAEASSDPRVTVTELPVRGLSRARNEAIRRALGELCAFLDDDCEAEPGWLAAIDRVFRSDARVGVVVGPLVKPKRSRRTVGVCPEFVVPTPLTYSPAPDVEAPAGFGVVGANLTIRRDVARTVGPFDEALGAGADFGAAEDVDYQLRLEAAGVTFALTPDAVVHHTFGYRYGLRALFSHKRNYARGNGALAAKLTLLGDPRGSEWLEGTRREVSWDRVRSGQLHRIPPGLFRYTYFRQAYRECLERYASTFAADADPLRAVLALGETGPSGQSDIVVG